MKPLPLSLLTHALLLGFILVLYVWHLQKNTIPQNEILKFTVIEKKDPVIPVEPPKTQIQAMPEKANKAVFGVSKRSLTSLKREGKLIEVKQGNTVNKTEDDTVLKEEDEYLITVMPKLLEEFAIPYPTDAKLKNVEGNVNLEIVVDKTGHVQSAKLLSGPGFGLNEAALKAIKDFKFSPALIDGKAVAVRIHYAVRFVLEK